MLSSAEDRGGGPHRCVARPFCASLWMFYSTASMASPETFKSRSRCATRSFKRSFFSSSFSNSRASPWKRFWSLTLPLLAPTTLFVGLVGMISTLQQFGLPYLVTNGGPGNATSLYVYQVYRETFQSGNLGYASAMSFAFLAVIMVLSLIQIRTGRRKEAL